MQDVFIRRIHIDKVRHLKDVDIVLSDTERMHLILTGKNGSGKTSLLEALRNSVILQQQVPYYNVDKDTKEKYYVNAVMNKPELSISYSQEQVNFKDCMFIYISAERSELLLPKSIEPMNIEEKTIITRNASKDFLKYILSLDYRLYGAQTEKNKDLIKNLKKWFDSFVIALRDIYSCPELELKRDTKNLRFIIEIPGREPFGLHEMADGYSAFLNILMELLMRFETADAAVEYTHPAIVLIDEIETHLHVELQKRVLPFLTQMFPNVQFIVSTHSPFIVTSLEKAIVYDLEKKERLDNPGFYSYETIVESFFDVDMYSTQLKNYLSRYKELCFKDRSPEENEEFLKAKTELELRSIPSTELYIAFQNLEKQRKAMKNGSTI